jgi:CheY-like chemotaxis protein
MAKILLVEDDKSLREIYGVRLLAEGYDIVSAGDGEEALAMAIKERPHLILSDVMMPKISGFDMLDILRSTSETKTIKVIMMTALSSDDQRQRGEQLGADRYLVKSQVGIEDVVRTVHEVLADTPTPGAEQNPFGSSVPRSAPSAAPAAPEMPQQQSTQPQVQTQPQPQLAPTASIQQPSAPAQASTLPQPTAPFSTARPAGLADRIIQPIERPETNDIPLASLMDRELNQQPPAPAPAPVAPPAPPAPNIEQPVSQPQQQEQPSNVAPQSFEAPQQPSYQPPVPPAPSQPQATTPPAQNFQQPPTNEPEVTYEETPKA